MSDATLLESLNTALTIHRMKVEEHQNIVATLEGTISSLYPPRADTPPTTGKTAVREKKAKVTKTFRKGANAVRITDEQIVDAAIGAIRRTGPQTLTTITKAVRKVYPKLKGGIGVALRKEEKRTGGRIGRDAGGKWTEKTTAKHVSDKRSADEVKAAFEQARAAQERQVDAA